MPFFTIVCCCFLSPNKGKSSTLVVVHIRQSHERMELVSHTNCLTSKNDTGTLLRILLQ